MSSKFFSMCVRPQMTGRALNTSAVKRGSAVADQDVPAPWRQSANKDQQRKNLDEEWIYESDSWPRDRKKNSIDKEWDRFKDSSKYQEIQTKDTYYGFY
jgi:hypothetical protein